MSNIFLPNHIDKKRSVLLQPQLIFVYLLLIFGTIFLSDSLVSRTSEILGYATDIKITELLNLTNETRSKKGLSTLTLNNKLSKAAELKANDMFEDDYWAHTAPDGKEPWDFIRSQEYYYVFAGENLAVDFSDSQDVVEAWIDSPTHRDNLLNANYSEIGFAVVNGELQGRKTTLVVQMFGKPRYSPPVASSAKIEDLPAPEEESVIPPIQASNESLADADIPKVEFDGITPPVQTEIAAGAVLNASDVFNVSRLISIVLGVFVTALFAVDGYYVRKTQMLRITGHTFLHMIFLILAIVGIWYSNIGLVL